MERGACLRMGVGARVTRRREDVRAMLVEGGGQGRRGSAFLAAQGLDDLADVADLGDLEAEVLADLDGFADGDGFVVDEQLEGLVAALGELDDGASAQAHDLGEGEIPLGKLDNDGDLEAQDALKLDLRGGRGARLGLGLQKGHGSCAVRTGLLLSSNLIIGTGGVTATAIDGGAMPARGNRASEGQGGRTRRRGRR